MKSDKKEILKEKCVELYLEGKTMQEISDIVSCSRNFVGQLLKDDEKIKTYRNKRKIKVYKYRNRRSMRIDIAVNLLQKIGISDDLNIEDFVNVELDEDNKIITIKKCDI